jgi:hypothetical protein
MLSVRVPSGCSQDTLTLGAMRERIRAGEIVQHTLWIPPLAHRTNPHRDIMSAGEGSSPLRGSGPDDGQLAALLNVQVNEWTVVEEPR